jgi:hypothetical protein
MSIRDAKITVQFPGGISFGIFASEIRQPEHSIHKVMKLLSAIYGTPSLVDSDNRLIESIQSPITLADLRLRVMRTAASRK